MRQLTPLQCGVLRNAIYHEWVAVKENSPHSLLAQQLRGLLDLLYESPTYPEGIYVKELNDEDSTTTE